MLQVVGAVVVTKMVREINTAAITRCFYRKVSAMTARPLHMSRDPNTVPRDILSLTYLITNTRIIKYSVTQ